MQFQVPQFIEVEDKIFGPLTFKQFIFLAGGAGSAYIFWRILPLFIAAPLMLGVIGFTVALAFVQYNGRPFLLALETGFYYLVHSKLYLWSNESHAKPKAKAAEPQMQHDLYVPRLSESKLHDLAWSLDIKERLQEGTGSNDDRETRNVMAPIRTPEEMLAHLQR